MKSFFLVTVSLVLITAMGVAEQPNYSEYDLLITETEHIGDSARFYLDELTQVNDSLLDIYFPKDAEK